MLWTTDGDENIKRCYLAYYENFMSTETFTYYPSVSSCPRVRLVPCVNNKGADQPPHPHSPISALK